MQLVGEMGASQSGKKQTDARDFRHVQVLRCLYGRRAWFGRICECNCALCLHANWGEASGFCLKRIKAKSNRMYAHVWRVNCTLHDDIAASLMITLPASLTPDAPIPACSGD